MRRSAIELVGLDVGGDGWAEHIQARIPSFKSSAKIGGRDVFMDSLQQMNAALLMWRQAERREIRKRETRAADNNPFGEVKQPFGLVPARQIEEAVRADEVEESRIGHGLVQRGERFDGVVRGAVRPRSVEVGDGKAWVLTTGKLYHGQPIGKWGWNAFRLQRLMANRGEENAVQIEYICSGGGDGDVTVMRRIEAAAKEGYAHVHSLADYACIITAGERRNPC